MYACFSELINSSTHIALMGTFFYRIIIFSFNNL